MIKRLLLLVTFSLIVSACAPATQPALMPFVITLTTPPPNFPSIVNTPSVPEPTATAYFSPTIDTGPTATAYSSPTIDTGPTATAYSSPTIDTGPTATAYSSPTAVEVSPTTTVFPTPFLPTETYIPYLATPTETQLPPLELPTEQLKPPTLLPWSGLPTYLADSDPGMLFRVDYDPKAWAQTAGNFGDIVLANRQIPYCILTPWSGRGLPVDWKVAHEFRNIGSASFDVNTVSSQGVLKFVSYVGGDHHVLTGFQVTFDTQSDACLQAAETVFGTLRSYAAVPTATPLSSPTP